MPSPSEASSSRQSSSNHSDGEEEEWKLGGDNDDESTSETSENAEEHDKPEAAEQDHLQDDEEEASKEPMTFESLDLIPPLLTAIKQMKYKRPTEIQEAVLPLALAGRDIIGVAETVRRLASLPRLSPLKRTSIGVRQDRSFRFADFTETVGGAEGPLCGRSDAHEVRLSANHMSSSTDVPFRELAYQISEQFESLGSAIGVRCAVIVGGMDMVTQAIALSKRPHIVVATPGRLNDHLENTKGFNLRYLKFLVRRYCGELSLM